jgi:DNA-binding transcriptional regulator GbsR (MarR family)
MARHERVDDDLDELVEEFALWFEGLTMPRMAGRILGWLLVCDPPEQTMRELAEQLQASMGSISTMTRMLERIGLLDRVSTPGERKVRYRIRPHALANIWKDQLEQARALQKLVDRTLEVLDGTGPERVGRLAVAHQFTSFYIEQLPRLIAEWEIAIAEPPTPNGRRRGRAATR